MARKVFIMDASDTRKLIGSRIAIARKAAGLDQESLAVSIGANKQTVSRWERGLRSPNGEFLYAIACTCGCSADFLLGMSDVLEVKS